MYVYTPLIKWLLPIDCIYVLRTILKKKSYFPKQHYSASSRNGGPLLFLWASKWIII